MTGSVDAPSNRSSSSSSLLAELVDRLTAQMQAGEPIDWDEVLRQHPEQAEELALLRPALGVLNDLSRSGDAVLSGLGTPSQLVRPVLAPFDVADDPEGPTSRSQR